MKRVQGSSGVSPLECVNPVRGKWRVRWDIVPHEDGTADYMEEEFDHRPTVEEIRAVVVGWYNQQTNEAIVAGFEWEGMPVWLSSENQFNYKAVYDLAVQTDGANLPVKFKFGTDDKPQYKVFSTLDELASFYASTMSYIQKILDDGWRKKDTFDVDLYLKV